MSYVVIPAWLVMLIIDIPLTFTHPLFAGDTQRITAIVALDILTMIVLVFVGRWFLAFRPFLKATMKIEDGAVTVSQGDGARTIELKNVKSVKFSAGPLQAIRQPAYVLLLTMDDGSEFGVPRAFQRLEYVTDTLAALRPELAAGAVWAKQRDFLVAQDHMMARLNDSLMNPARILTLYIGLPLALGTLLTYHLGLQRTVNAVLILAAGFFLLSLLVGAGLRRFTDRVLRRKLLLQLKRDGKELRRDMIYEKMLAFRRFVAHTVILALPILIWVLSRYWA